MYVDVGICSQNDVLIMAYNFGIMDLQIHTFSGVMNTNGRIDLFNEKCNMNSSTDIGSVNEITNTSDELFRVGYILKWLRVVLMKIKLKYIMISILVVIIILVVIVYRCYFYYTDIQIKVSGLYNEHSKVVCLNNNYYKIQDGNIYNLDNQKKHISDKR